MAAAKAIWQRLLEERGEDPVAVTRVADWLRQAGDAEGAKALYRRAAELAPEDPRYREYLGEYLHVLGESEAAVAVWTELAAGENRGVKTLARLSEVLGGFGYDERAASAAAEADALDVKEAGTADPTAGALEFADRMRFAELFSRAGRADAAEGQIAKAEALAVTLEERRAALNAAIDADQAADRLEDRIEELKATAAAEPQNADVRLRLALYQDAAGDPALAAASAAEASALAPADVIVLATLTELQEQAGFTADAAASARRLAGLDRQRRADHLMRLAELQLRLGQQADALRTAREVVAGAPGSPEALAFLSRVAFRTGDEEAGFDALRRAARNATRDAGPLLALADALAERFRTDEAVELLWRAFADDSFANAAPAVVVTDTNRSGAAEPSRLAPPELDAMRSATLRLLTDRPADVPGAFAAAAKVRVWAAGRLEQSKGSPNLARPAQRAILANLLLAQTALERPEHRDAARAEFAALEEWANAHGRIGQEYLSMIRELHKQADGAGAASADEAATEAPAP
ncbi:hypothetical protein [Alienimonas californiensis]|uniref:Uncharacterized protein n=1 Tax=Alienimonas californiensis TaxID=2527989 RepID=A0A517PA23_9PLAN|nr:hypothetical protein [Alienimonas californiensis]QDT16223.1 hypothetical protein CA12_23230 [Alienimonas californiensis]